MMLTNEQRDNLYNIAITEVQKIRFSSDFMNILSSIWMCMNKTPQEKTTDSVY